LGVSVRRAARYAWAVGFWEPRFRPAGLALAHRLGLMTTVYTVNDERRMRELVSLGVDGIFSDRPGLLRRVVRG
jgi:glycerophosphoryl diester phosphodiesterase